MFLAAFILAIATLTQTARPADQESGPAPAVKPVTSALASAPEGLKLILLKPSVRLNDVAEAEDGEYHELLFNAAKQGVGSKAALLDSGALGPSVIEACKKLEPLASRLARGNENQEAIEGLARLAALDEHFAILVQFLRLETGPGRSWSPITGAITSSTNSTLIQASLVSAKTGKVIWKGEQLIRNKALKSADPNLSKALTALYRDFDIK